MGVADGLRDARVSRADNTFSPRLLQALRVFLATSQEMQQEAGKGGGRLLVYEALCYWCMRPYANSV